MYENEYGNAVSATPKKCMKRIRCMNRFFALAIKPNLTSDPKEDVIDLNKDVKRL